MFLLDYVSPEKAKSTIDEIYSFFPDEIGPPPSITIDERQPWIFSLPIRIYKILHQPSETELPIISSHSLYGR